MTALRTSILDTVVTKIQSLSLSGIASASIVKRQVISDLGVTKPWVQVVGQGRKSDPLAGTNASDEYVYPVVIAIAVATNEDQTAGSSGDTYSTWEESITAAFQNKRLVGVSEVFTAKATTYELAETEAWRKLGINLTAILVEFRAMITRS